MPNISDSFRTLAIALLFLIGLFGWLLPMTLLLAPFGKHTEAMRHRLMWRACRFAARHLPGTKLEMKGEKEAEWQRPSVLVSNHQSSLDLLCLLMLSPRLVVVTNQRQWRNALYGAVIRRLNFLPVGMGFDAMQQQVGRLAKEGYSVVIFPEGTRHAEIGEGKTGAAMLAIRTGVPILPVYITPERKLFQRTKVYIGEPYMPFTEKRRANAEDYERVTEDIMGHIRAIRDTRAEREVQG